MGANLALLFGADRSSHLQCVLLPLSCATLGGIVGSQHTLQLNELWNHRLGPARGPQELFPATPKRGSNQLPTSGRLGCINPAVQKCPMLRSRGQN